jgi:hypothetical protein
MPSKGRALQLSFGDWICADLGIVKMKVFISWSGERSQALALALKKWIQLVLHYAEPWVSDVDIAAGERWAQVVAKELEACHFGIICVTPENMTSPWVLFEAGALAKSMQGKVIPVLFDLEFSDVSGPLSQFQAKKISKAGLGEIILSINQTAEKRDPEERVKEMIDALWPKFEVLAESIPDEAPSAKHMRPQHEILEELVASVRGLDSRFLDLQENVSERSPRSRRKLRRMHPMMLEDMAHMASEEGDDPLALLMVAGLMRDDLPWLYELVVEVYREIRGGDAKTIQKSITRLRRVTKMLRRGPFMDMMMDDSKESHIFVMEFPHMLERFLHRYDGQKLDGPPEDELDPTKQDPI